MKDYEFILKRLEDEGFESYLVGGFIRDSLLKRKNYDIDIATRARPFDILRVFSDMKLIDIGKKFGTIKVIYRSKEYEITTFRKESSYKDRRHPDEVFFSDNIYDDLKRRDFTINAMASRDDSLIDIYGGRDDLDKKIIRAVGDAYERIEEDYLRSLRAIRFATSLGFKIEDRLKDAIKNNAPRINDIARERIKDEINKILLSKKPSYGIRLLDELDLLKEIFPELKPMVGFDQKSSHHNLSLFDHTMEVLDKTKPKLKTRMAALFHDVGKVSCMVIDEKGEGRFFAHQKKSKEILEKRLKILTYSKSFIRDTGILVNRHMDSANTYTKKSIRKLLRRVGEDNIYDLFDLQKSDSLASLNQNVANISNAKIFLEEILKDNFPQKSKDIKINGKDLLAMGFKEGRIIGIILDNVENLVFDELLKNEKNEIIKYIKNKYIEVDR